ncbi:MAG: hypothetical protein Q7U64_05685 [Desulfocapsaceae bacterium]|nr:hypothetical protein [Desulfocapsaceae bacterium]
MEEMHAEKKKLLVADQARIEIRLRDGLSPWERLPKKLYVTRAWFPERYFVMAEGMDILCQSALKIDPPQAVFFSY